MHIAKARLEEFLSKFDLRVILRLFISDEVVVLDYGSVCFGVVPLARL